MQTFIDYLTQAAPEGETILLVKQKPRIYDGQPALHNDGTPKYSWPPFLPERYKQKPAAAWYANTAIFIVDRFKDGKLSTGAAYCKYVAFMVLDDIGTKSKRLRWSRHGSSKQAWAITSGATRLNMTPSR